MKRTESGKKIKPKDDKEVSAYRDLHDTVYHYYEFADSGHHVSNDNLDTINMLNAIKLDVLRMYSGTSKPKKKSNIVELNQLKKAWMSQLRKK